MKRIGLMVAVEIESVLKSGFAFKNKTNVGKFAIYEYEHEGVEVFAIHSGAGQTFASAATEILISIYHVEAIINFGVVGALKEHISINNVCLVDKIIDYQFDTTAYDHCELGQHDGMETYMVTNPELKRIVLSLYPHLPLVICASGNKFVDQAEEKRELAKSFHADIVEMEAASVEVICRMHDIPAVYIKGISDTLTGGAEEFGKMLRTASDTCFEVIKGLISSGMK